MSCDICLAQGVAARCSSRRSAAFTFAARHRHDHSGPRAMAPRLMAKVFGEPTLTTAPLDRSAHCGVSGAAGNAARRFTDGGWRDGIVASGLGGGTARPARFCGGSAAEEVTDLRVPGASASGDSR